LTAVIIPQGSEQAYQLSEYAVDLMPGASTTATFTGTTPSSVVAGTYTLYIANIADNGAVEPLSEPQTITISASTTPVIGMASFSIANSSSVNPDAITVTYRLTNTGGTFIGNLEFAIFAPGQSSTNNILNAPLIEVPGGTTEPMEFTAVLKFPAAVAGTTYSLVPYISNKQLAYGQSFTVSTSTGIDDVAADSDAVVTAIYTLSGQPVPTLDTTSLAPGLYIVVTTQGSYKHIAR
ncbi:MAG: hypothetical protein K2K72_07390, partial [Duncaniella sp.]|nr:hypothetical protein [Duncaniella sp.]